MVTKVRDSIEDRQMQETRDSPVFFPWLTEIRFFAAMLVFVQHAVDILQTDGLINIKESAVQFLGMHGVQLFFVLSGFLITSLLIKEQAASGTIAMKKFYTRRALRIWPLYYALFVVAFVLPASWLVIQSGSEIAHLGDIKLDHLAEKIVLFTFMLPNVALVLYGPVAGFAQSWSIGVEEQFYLLWPALFKVTGKHILPALLSVIAIKTVLVTGTDFYLHNCAPYSAPGSSFYKLMEFVSHSLFFLQFEAMAIGGIGAICFAKFPETITKIVNQSWFRFLILAGIGLTLSATATNFFGVLASDIVWIGFLLSLTTCGISVPVINHPLNYLGKISYGIYMIHPLVDFLVAKTIWSTTKGTSPLSICAYFLTSLGLTIAISAFSYEFFEKRFLRIKTSFEVIKSSCSQR